MILTLKRENLCAIIQNQIWIDNSCSCVSMQLKMMLRIPCKSDPLFAVAQVEEATQSVTQFETSSRSTTFLSKPAIAGSAEDSD